MKKHIAIDGNIILSPDAPHGRMERLSAGIRNIISDNLSDEQLLEELDQISYEEYGIFAPTFHREEILVLVGRMKKKKTNRVIGKIRDHLQYVFPMPAPVSAFQRNGAYHDAVARATAAKSGVDALRKYFESQTGEFLSCLEDVTGFESFDEFLDANYSIPEIQYIPLH